MDTKEYMSDFLRSYLVFAAGTTATGEVIGVHNHFDFHPELGLCCCVDDYFWGLPDNLTHPQHEYFENLHGWMCDLLDTMLMEYVETGVMSTRDNIIRDGYTAFPFGEENYYARTNNATQHEDPDRLAFVQHAITKLEAECALA